MGGSANAVMKLVLRFQRLEEHEWLPARYMARSVFHEFKAGELRRNVPRMNKN
jgi:hypothetical protein